MSKTKIVATFGPASDTPPVIRTMIKEGVDCARINLSHGDKNGHQELISTLKKFRKEMDVPLSIIADTKGPEVRMKPIDREEISLEEGQRLELVSDQDPQVGDLLVGFSELGDLLSVGDEVLVGDGDLSLAVAEVGEDLIQCEALSSGRIAGRQRITVPGKSFPIPSITDEDEEDIGFAVSEGVDWIALSFIKSADDIRKAREIVHRASGPNRDIPIMAKIETVEAVENIREITREADGLMVARGDLAMAIGLEEVPFLQKKIIRLANDMAKPVVTATQMLETMIEAPTPTRAEITDVANAVLDGTDAVMLSGETAIGDYPVKTVTTMRKLAEKAEANFPQTEASEENLNREKDETAPEIGRAACTMAERLDARAIITSTRSGYTARLISRFRPKVRIVAVTPSELVYNRLAMVWGITPIQVETTQDTDKMIEKSIRSVKEAGYVDSDDLVVVTAGVPFAVEGTTNLIKVEKVD
ncbi:pyruvate kinase [Candidatus Bipolaricaulota bacterium]|nr:pyruvate kinase [Candidatus Bipolaricaulota bacterium]